MDDAAKRKHQPGARSARRKVVEEPFDRAPPPSTAAASAAAPPSHLVVAIVEKGFSAAAPSSAPRPTVLPFPVARHRSHGPHRNPAAKDAGKAEGDEEEGGMDVDETDYQPAAASAGPVRRKERKGMDFSLWREFVADDAPPKRRQMKSLQPKEQNAQKIDPAGDVASKLGGAKGERGLREDGMQLDNVNGREELGPAALVSDLASRKVGSRLVRKMIQRRRVGLDLWNYEERVYNWMVGNHHLQRRLMQRTWLGWRGCRQGRLRRHRQIF